jgi:putative hydrolase of the HAD superfamily
VKGIVFDLVGVIVDGNSGAFYRELCTKYSFNIDYQYWKVLYHQASAGKIAYQEFVRSLSSKLSISSADLETKLAETVLNRARMIYGAFDVLAQVKKLGLRTAILTNNIAEWVGIIDAKFHLSSFVERIFVSSMMDVRKPSARAYLLAANALGIPPQQVVYVGDEDEDIRGARNVGMTTIFIPGEDGMSYSSHYKISNIKEILRLPLFANS